MILLSLALAICPESGPRASCVVDGDTLWLGTEKVRLAGIDTPETDQAKCPSERAAGERAKRRLHQLVNSGPLSITRTGKDRYGRTLATLYVNGVDVGSVMIAEGHAREYAGGRRPWC